MAIARAAKVGAHLSRSDSMKKIEEYFRRPMIKGVVERLPNVILQCFNLQCFNICCDVGTSLQRFHFTSGGIRLDTDAHLRGF